MTSWQRRLRLGLAVFVVALAAWLVVSLRRSPPPPPTPILVPRSDPNIVAESTSGRSLRVLGGKPDISVEHYDKLVQYADGRTRLTGVRVKVLQRRGRDFTIVAATADVVGQTPSEDVRLKGAVEITSSDGLVVRTEEASYDHAAGVVLAPGPVEFSRAGLSGRAVGLRYDRNPDRLSLLDEVVVHRRPDAGGEGALDIDAGSASLARGEEAMRFGGGVRVDRAGQAMAADSLTAFLTDDGERLRRLELRGHSQVTGAPKGDGGPTAMQARDIDLAYADDARTLQHATLTGDGMLELAGSGGGAARRLAAQYIDVGLGPDGVAPTSLLAQDGVVFDLLPDRSTPARRIRSGVLQAAGTPKSGLRAASFGNGVEFHESPSAPAAPRIARSSTLALTFGDGLGRVESARFDGDVVFTQGSLTARAQEARYDMAAGALHLSGRDERSGHAPQVSDDRAAIEGDAIDVVLDGHQISANGSVKTEMRGGEQDARQEGARSRVPAMLQTGQPVRAAAGRLVYDGGASLATYGGGADLWQDQVAIKAATIVLDERKGSLSAVGDVVTRMQFDRAGGGSKEPEPGRMVVTASRMVYDDDARRLTYTGGAHLNGPEGDLSSGQVVVWLRAGTREMERLEAQDAVSLGLPQGRHAAGTHLVYRAEAEQYRHGRSARPTRRYVGRNDGQSFDFLQIGC